ncbi:peroxidase [Streptomyces sp. NPDC059411]|uniref:peroxidase n=1 Tax=Streptomyces sp. NPDC059411 TaxID=3346825 RepID=UPI0036CE6498
MTVANEVDTVTLQAPPTDAAAPPGPFLSLAPHPWSKQMVPASPPPPGCPHAGPARRTVVQAAAFAAVGIASAAVPGLAPTAWAAEPAPRAGAGAGTAARVPAAKAAADALPLRADRDSQGDILAGFRKDQACLLFLHFGDAAKARQWLGRLLPSISTTEEVARFNQDFSRARKRSGGIDPVSMSGLWTGLSLTHPGLRLFGGKEPFPAAPPGSNAEAFTQGAAARAQLLGDTGTSAPQSWLFGAEQSATAVHAVLTLAADNPDTLAEAVADHRDGAGAAGATVVFRQDGATLPDALRGHEHFGFADCISQPGVRGFDEPDPATGTTVLGKPGTRLIPAGEFLVGRERVGQRSNGLPAWATGGAFQVVRRLAQDVPGWWTQVALRLAELQKAGSAPADAGKEWLGARLMGRWPNGMPVAVCPAAQQPREPGVDPDAKLDYGADPNGWGMPLFAHIRKGNPRGGLVLTPGRPPLAQAELDGRRLMRRGIPYGPVYNPELGDGHGPEASRGLLFICHQADLVGQFELVVRKWLNEPDFPAGRNPRTGCDPVLGPDSALAFETPSATGSRADTLYFSRFVRTEGSVYAFSPSLSVLRALAGGHLDDSIEFHTGSVLHPGEVLDAGKVRLTLDSTGDLALLDSQGRRLWHSDTGGSGHDAVLTSDGELVVRTAEGRPAWSSDTAGHAGARLLLRPSGELVILDGDRVLWRASAS